MFKLLLSISLIFTFTNIFCQNEQWRILVNNEGIDETKLFRGITIQNYKQELKSKIAEKNRGRVFRSFNRFCA